jgi:sporulation protein YlmC with PRC-barrel domain
MWKHSGLAFCLALVASSFAVGQQVVQEVQPAVPVPAGANPEIRRVSQILGANVRLQGEDSYGKVDDIVLDETGTIQYLVVTKGDRYVMMPYNAANIDYGQHVVIYDVTPQAVQPLFFERNAWPTLTDPQYTTRIRQIFPRAGVGRGAVRGRFAPPVGRPAPPPDGAVIEQKVKVRPNGDVRVKERVKEVVK